jgi:hypothetical protein
MGKKEFLRRVSGGGEDVLAELFGKLAEFKKKLDLREP